jgi:hypothetical protein
VAVEVGHGRVNQDKGSEEVKSCEGRGATGAKVLGWA